MLETYERGTSTDAEEIKLRNGPTPEEEKLTEKTEEVCVLALICVRVYWEAAASTIGIATYPMHVCGDGCALAMHESARWFYWVVLWQAYGGVVATGVTYQEPLCCSFR